MGPPRTQNPRRRDNELLAEQRLGPGDATSATIEGTMKHLHGNL